MKKSPALAALIALGMTAGASAQGAERNEVSMAEEQASLSANSGFTPEHYPGQVVRLARIYHEHGRLYDSEETFKKAIALYKNLPGGESRIPGVLIVWARVLARKPNAHVQDLGMSRDMAARIEASERAALDAQLVKAQNVAREGVALVVSKPELDDQDLHLLLQAVQVFETAENTQGKEDLISTIDDILSRMAQNEPLSAESKIRIGENYNKLAELYCRSPYSPNLPTGRPVAIVADDFPRTGIAVKQKDYRMSEYYRLRAMEILDTLPPNHQYRIVAQRALACWYKYYGQTREELLQTQKLSSLLHSTDQNVLFPIRRICTGCGRG